MKLMMDDHERDLDADIGKSSSECSSGCQSGWTMYLDHSSAPHSRQTSMQQQDEDEGDSDEEDLSMVSDASSGPAHFHEDDDEEEDEHCYYCGNSCCFCPKNNNSGKKRRVEIQQQQNTKQTPHYSLLDDTASSPLFSFSNTSCTATNTSNSKKKLYAEDVLELSCGFSATQFKENSALRKRLGYFNSCAGMKPNSVCKQGGEEKLW